MSEFGSTASGDRTGTEPAVDVAEIVEEWPLKRLLTEVIGSGPKTADDMTYAQAYGSVTQLLDGDPDPTTLGAFLLANRWKHNTPVEIAAFVDAMRDRSTIAIPHADAVDCGASYNGKRKSALLGVGAGLVAAAAGTPVVVHSADRVPTKRATAYMHVLDELGVSTDVAPAESARMVDEVGFGFYYQPRFSPAIHATLDRREQMGVRTLVNTIETLSNPAGASAHLGSFFHLPFARRMIEAVRESRTLEFERVLMIQGIEGYDDARLGTTRIAEWTAGGDGAGVETEASDGAEPSIEDDTIDTAALGIDADREDLAVEDVAVDSARLTEAILDGEHRGPVADALALNAGLRIYAGGDADSIGAGIEAARDALAGDDAARRLDRLRSFDADGTAST